MQPNTTQPPFLVTPKGKTPAKDSRTLIAGSARLLTALREEGLSPINPDKYLPRQDQNEILATIAEIIRSVEAFFAKNGQDGARSDAALVAMAAEAFQALATIKVGENYGLQKNEEMPTGMLAATHIDKSMKPKPADIGALDRALFFKKPFVLDFSSQSGKTVGGKNAPTIIRPIMDKEPGSAFSRNLSNRFQLFKTFGANARLRYKIPSVPTVEQDYPAPQLISQVLEAHAPQVLVAQLVNICIKAMVTYDQAQASMGHWLDGLETKPLQATFNNMGTPDLAGFGAALKARNIPVIFKSHGSMIVHGSEDRQTVSTLLSRAIYNTPHCATILEPRSPLQIKTASENQAIKHKTSPQLGQIPQEKRREGSFRIFLAPNFLSWFACYHGMTPTCFDTDAVIRALAGTIALRDDMELFIRLKTTTADKAKATLKRPVRGLLPEDFKDLYDSEKGVHDASVGSHKQLLADADLVVTEGATAVMFEALEHRKPVLFLHRYSDQEPAMPAIDLSADVLPTERSATYCANIGSDLNRALVFLKEQHKGRLLDNQELDGKIWLE